jgi:hypothetical protein
VSHGQRWASITWGTSGPLRLLRSRALYSVRRIHGSSQRTFEDGSSGCCVDRRVPALLSAGRRSPEEGVKPCRWLPSRGHPYGQGKHPSVAATGPAAATYPGTRRCSRRPHRGRKRLQYYLRSPPARAGCSGLLGRLVTRGGSLRNCAPGGQSRDACHSCKRITV